MSAMQQAHKQKQSKYEKKASKNYEEEEAVGYYAIATTIKVQAKSHQPRLWQQQSHSLEREMKAKV